MRPGREGHDHQPRHGPRLHDGPADRGPLPPVQDRVRGQDRRPARRQRRRAAGLRRHDDRRQQRHREGDRPGPPDGHRVRDERSARTAVASASATSSCSSAARSASSATTPTRSPSRSTRRSGRSSTGPTSGRSRSSTTHRDQLDAAGREARRRGDRRLEGFEASSATCRRRPTGHAPPVIVGPGQPSRTPSPSRPDLRLITSSSTKADRRRSAFFMSGRRPAGRARSACPSRASARPERSRMPAVDLADRRQDVPPDRTAMIPTTGTARNIPEDAHASAPPAGIIDQHGSPGGG